MIPSLSPSPSQVPLQIRYKALGPEGQADDTREKTWLEGQTDHNLGYEKEK